MEKKKFNFKKFSLVLCICFITLFAFIPFANFTNVDFVNAEIVTTSVYVSDDSLLSPSTNSELTSVIGKKWYGIDYFPDSNYIWNDGDNFYYSNGSDQYVLDKETSTWNTKSWNGLTAFRGSNVWTDGDNFYYSNGSDQYVLDKETSTWNTKSWNGFTSFSGSDVWTDGNNIYYSYTSKQYVLDKETSTWSSKSWSGLTSILSSNIWTDGENFYISGYGSNYILDKETSTWNTKSWNGLTAFSGSNVWTDGNNIYYSYSSQNYVLDKETSTWSTKLWNGLYFSFSGSYVWTDGINYYSTSPSCSIQFTTYTDYELGLSNGYEQGKNDGLDEGYQNGYEQGKNDGLDEGYQNGYDKGNTDGYASGKADGFIEGYQKGYNKGNTDGYASGKADGLDEASNNYYSYGPFSYSTISYYSASSSGININNPLTYLYSGYFTSYECVEAYNGGFYLYDEDIEVCMIDNEDLQVGLRVVFDTPISCLRYSHLVPLRLGFGNIITLSFTDGTSTSFNMADAYYDYIDLSDYSSKYILSLDVIMLGLDYIDIGLAFSNDYVHIYDLAYRDGRDDGYSEGKKIGYSNGYNNGYNVGVDDSNQYSFYNLFGAVLDAPVRVFSDLFNFNLLGINLLGLITGLFTLAMIILIIKLILGGK